MDTTEREIKKTLKRHLKGVAGQNIDSLAGRIGGLPYEHVMAALDSAIAIAASNLRAAAEMLKVAPEVARLVDAGDLRLWGEIGKRLSATSLDSAVEFFQSSPRVLDLLEGGLRPQILRLVNKQAALSSNTAVESFKTAPSIISRLNDPDRAEQVLTICLELARQSVKHSNDLLKAAPQVLSELSDAFPSENAGVIDRALALTSAFAHKSGGTAAEFFAELPQVAAFAGSASLDKLFSNTEAYLDRSGGVALQYFKAAGRVLSLAGDEPFERWTALARRVALQGNAASYHFMKASPQIVADLSAQAGERARARVVASVLEVIEEISERNSVAAVECFKASPAALRSATLGQFREWARKGIETATGSPRKTQAYYALESKASQEALVKIEGGLTLDSVGHTLRLYVEGLTGRALNVAPLSSIPDETKIGDGKTIFLPSVVAEFEAEAENFRLFKVLAAHAAGQVEFETYAQDLPGLSAALAEIRAAFSDGAPGPEPDAREVDFLRVLDEFPNSNLALRLFTTIENGRIDFLLRATYKGIRRDMDFVRGRLLERRPLIEDLPQDLLPFELLFQIAVCGGATSEARRAYPLAIRDIENILARYIFISGATVGDSLIATRHVYGLFVQAPDRPNAENDEASGSGDGNEGGKGDLATSAESEEEMGGQRDSLEVQGDPFSFWSAGQAQDMNPDRDYLTRREAVESAEQDLEKGDRAFYYDEWDRELGDYRTRWCRVIERAGAEGGRGFVEVVRSRYSGIISSIRYQFQLLRPENLKRLRGEVDGEDYDLQAVIDYALDKRSTGMIDDRLYTRKLRRERDVAVSFLLDMSSSTARTISRHPNNPYTQPGQRIIDIEKEGLVLMSEALEAVGDVYSMQGFTSEGRRNVKFYVVKDFSERYSPEVERRIGGITYQNNTRLGAAVRHAASLLSAQEARTKLLIVLSDGRPYDHDYGDSRYAREDTRMALRQARIDGITPFCITIDRESEDHLRDLYGEVGYTIIDDVLSLPERLPGIYSRLTT
ncbi:MAG TPA: VWA domain-containing protein [Blastocatellia bacterium]|nr:VWA domain-containing protein [Blastocatellia bacterium]